MYAFRLALLSAALVAAATAADSQVVGRGRGQSQVPQNAGEAPPPKRVKTFPTNATWVAITLNGKTFGGERPTMILDDQFRMRGFGGCNTFSATAYPLRQQAMTVGPFALTKKACDKSLMASEKSFLTALRAAVQWDSDGKELVVRGTAGELKFERVL